MTSLIAELCQNHNGDMDLVREMVVAAAENGATHAKIQTIYASALAFRPQFEEGLVTDGKTLSIKRPYQPEYDRLKSLELSDEDTIEFIEICKQYNIVPMTTCFARGDVQRLKGLGFDAIKVASYDCASFQMLRELKHNFNEIYVSTGASYDDEIEMAARELEGSKFTLLHCVTLYPTPLEEMHLDRMNYLRTLATKVGFSDHSLVDKDGVLASKAAIALGAEVIERHFTILRADESRDGPVSITPKHLKELSEFSKLTTKEQLEQLAGDFPEWELMRGSINRNLSDSELLNRDYYRGRFASPRNESVSGRRMIYNWEEVPL